MEFVGRMARLLRRPVFKRIVVLRLLSQGGDATLQVAMGSYLLLNPQTQPNGLAIAAALTLTVLPFSIVGPFLSPILDRFPRQRIVIVCDLVRVGLSVGMGAIVATGLTTGVWQLLLFALLLVALSINRLQLAALSAGLPFSIEKDEYVEAMSVMPILGPAAAVVGGVLAGALRLGMGRMWQPNQADGLVFALAALMFAGAITVCQTIGLHVLGPLKLVHRRLLHILSGLTTTAVHLRKRPAANQAVLTVLAARLSWGAVTVLAILVFRHHFNTGDLNQAMIWLGMWLALTGVGFALSGTVASPLIARIGLRNAMLGMLTVAGVIQLLPALWLHKVAFMVSGFVIGVGAQSVKICVDTVVQANVADRFRGRVFVLYDIANNMGMAIGAFVAGLLLPTSGASRLGIAVIAAWYFVIVAVVAFASRPHLVAYERGTRAAQQQLPTSNPAQP